eukprot:jgi/Botrbrau1/6067/Bobra.177_1s0007.1
MAGPEGLGGCALEGLASASPLRVLHDLAPSVGEDLLIDLVSSQPFQVKGGFDPQRHDAQVAHAAAAVRSAVALCTALAHSDKVPLGPEGTPVPSDLYRIRTSALGAFASLQTHLSACSSEFVKLWVLNVLAFMLQMDIVTFSNAALDAPRETPPLGPPPPEGLALELLSHIIGLMRTTLNAVPGRAPPHPQPDTARPAPAASPPTTTPARGKGRRFGWRKAKATPVTGDVQPETVQPAAAPAESTVLSGAGLHPPTAEVDAEGRASQQEEVQGNASGWEAEAMHVLADWLVGGVEEAEWRLDLLRRMTPSSQRGPNGHASTWGWGAALTVLQAAPATLLLMCGARSQYDLGTAAAARYDLPAADVAAFRLGEWVEAAVSAASLESAVSAVASVDQDFGGDDGEGRAGFCHAEGASFPRSEVHAGY